MRLSLKTAIETTGLLKVGINLNDYFSFEKANEYGATYVENFAKRNLKDTARQEKSSKYSVLGKLVEEVIIYLLDNYFKQNNCNYLYRRLFKIIKFFK